MKCKFCGKEIEEGSLFCGYCGKEQPKGKLCIYCGREIEVDADFCGYCGSKQVNNETIEKSVTHTEIIPTQESRQNKVQDSYASENIRKETESMAKEVHTIPIPDDNRNNESPLKIKIRVIIAGIVGIALLTGACILFSNNKNNDTSSDFSKEQPVESTQSIEDKELTIGIVPPATPTGSLVSECPNGGNEASYIQAWGILPTDEAIDIFLNKNIKYYVSGNMVQIWNGNSILAEYTTGSAEEIQSFKIYSKMISELRSKKNRIYSSFEGKAHHEEGPIDGYFFIDDGILKHYALNGNSVYINKSEHTKYDGKTTSIEAKSFDIDGSIISHTLTEMKKRVENGEGRDTKTTYYDNNGKISYYITEITSEIDTKDDTKTTETIKTTKYDKNNNVVSAETRTESYYLE